MQIKTHFSAGNTRSVFSEQINIDKKIHISAFVSAGFLFVFSAMAVFPVVNSFSGAEATAVISETTLAMTTSDINLPLSVTDLNGSFVAGDPADFTVTTNNYSGYTLSVSAKTDDENYSKLVNGNDVFNSISSATDATGFNNGNWGYMPSKLNSSANTSYQPAPTFAGDTLDVTAAANNEANTYSIALGAKADYSLPSGKYSNTFVITAIANPVGYAISYSANTEDQTVAGIPSTQVGDTTTTSVELSSNVPTRTGYAFNDWCDGTVTATMGVDSCTGTVYAPGDTYDMDQTGANVLTLKAMWNRKYTISFDANTGTGTMPDQVITGSYSLLDENLFTKDGYDFDGWNTEANGSGTGYTDMDDFNVPATGTGTTLYAQWKQIIVTFDEAYAAAGKTKDTTSDKYKMQDMTSAICDAVTEGQTTLLVDVRDGTTYNATKAADGRCWMQDNLALDLTAANASTNITTANTNADADSLTSLFSGNRANGGQYATAGVSNWTSSYSYSAPLINVTNKDVLPTTYNGTDEPLASIVASENWKVGVYYNYCAASAGSYCYGSGTSASTTDSTAVDKPNTAIDAEYDICPSGWRMPTGYSYDATARPDGGEYLALYNAYSGTSGTGEGSRYANFRKALRLPLSGGFYNGSVDYQGSNGGFWSSTYYGSNGTYYLNVGTSGIDPQYDVGRSYGLSIRCIARNGEEPGTFNRAFADANKTKATASDGKQYYKMQDMTSSICGTITTGQTSTLVDIRDGGTYRVGKLQDNKCWLLDNLALDLTNTDVKNAVYDSGDSTHDTMTNATNTQLGYLFNGGRVSGDSTTDNLPTAGIANWTSSYSYSAPLVNMTNKDVVPQGSSDPLKDLALTESWKVGGYYNYCAASAGSYCYGNGTSQGSPSGNASSDICPSGWRMPTGGASGEYQALATIINEASGDITDSTKYTNFRNALSLPLSGYFYGGSEQYQGSNGNFWSSTYLNNRLMYSLLANTSDISPQSLDVRYTGYSVRCVAQ